MSQKLKAFVANNRKTLAMSGAGATALLSQTAFASAIAQADVDAIVTGVTADAGIAIAAGFSILAVVLGARVGFGLVKSFIASGAS